MSIFIDRTFLLRVSPKLEKFTQKKEDLYNFRCPLCGDSHKNKAKCRGYVYRKKNDYFYMCHNCGASTSFYNFLDKVDSTLVKEYALERYKDGENRNYTKPTFEEFKTERPVFKKSLGIPTIDSLPKDHDARLFVEKRQIPQERYNQLYFAEDFRQFAKSLGLDQEGLKDNDARLVIPFYDQDKNLIAIQGRTLGDSVLRYVTIKTDDSNEKIYGMDTANTEHMIYVVEGPFDSMFVNNAIATADSNLEHAATVYDKSNITLVFDNEPRNKEIVKKMEKAIEDHYNVVIWPEMIEEKDINDMILAGFTQEELQDIISKHTFINLRAKMEFVNWKKV